MPSTVGPQFASAKSDPSSCVRYGTGCARRRSDLRGRREAGRAAMAARLGRRCRHQSNPPRAAPNGHHRASARARACLGCSRCRSPPSAWSWAESTTLLADASAADHSMPARRGGEPDARRADPADVTGLDPSGARLPRVAVAAVLDQQPVGLTANLLEQCPLRQGGKHRRVHVRTRAQRRLGRVADPLRGAI